VCGVDLSAAVVDKLAKNARKYPAEQCRGRSDKYHAYKAAAVTSSQQQQQQQKDGGVAGDQGQDQ
jgi:hypothetical protein